MDKASRRRRVRAPVALVVLFACGPAAGETLRVAAHALEPCVVERPDGSFTGFEVELLRQAAKRLDIDLAFHRVDRFADLFAELSAGRADLAVAGTTITSERERTVDFSHPTLTSGYSILVQKRVASSFLGDMADFITQPHLLTLLGAFFLFLLICAHVAWLAERGKEAISDRYLPGIFEALWFVWVTSTTVGYGDIAPRKWVGRLAASLIMLVGIGFAGILISELSSFRVTEQLVSGIEGPADLAGKRVATKAGSSSVAVLQRLNARVAAHPTIEAAYEALARGRVQAVVFDTPVIRHYVRGEGAQRALTVAGAPFNRQSYGFALPQGSPWRERINDALLGLIEDGAYRRLYRRYFGDQS